MSPVTEAVSIVTPHCEPGIGRIIRTPDSSDGIDGVEVRAYDLWPDDRGYFLEVIRLRQGLAAEFPVETTQVSAALSYPGTIKAFHFHKFQTDLVGNPRKACSKSRWWDLCAPIRQLHGLKNTLYAGAR